MEHEGLKNQVESLFKKDDDATIYDVDNITGDLIIETRLDELPDEMYDVTPTDSTLLEDELYGESMDIYVRMMQIVFLTNAMLAFMAITIGIVPYMLLSIVNHAVAIYFFIGVCVACAISYILMVGLQRQFMVIIWAFTLCITLGSTSAVLNEFAPLQTATVVFLQSITLVAYTSISRRQIKVGLAVLMMVGTGIIAWTIGIYAFVEQQDWVSAAIVLVLVLFFSLYSGWQAENIDRYSLSQKDMINAIVHFYGDVVLSPLKMLKGMAEIIICCSPSLD